MLSFQERIRKTKLDDQVNKMDVKKLKLSEADVWEKKPHILGKFTQEKVETWERSGGGIN